MNDEILERDAARKAAHTTLSPSAPRSPFRGNKSPGKLITGLTLEDTIEKQLIKETIRRVNEESDWMELHKKLPLGPGDYDISH